MSSSGPVWALCCVVTVGWSQRPCPFRDQSQRRTAYQPRCHRSALLRVAGWFVGSAEPLYSSSQYQWPWSTHPSFSRPPSTSSLGPLTCCSVDQQPWSTPLSFNGLILLMPARQHLRCSREISLWGLLAHGEMAEPSAPCRQPQLF